MRCPGQDTRYWKDDAIFEVECPHCGALVEFFKDDTSRKCPSCKRVLVNPRMDFGCALYCQYAELCLGELPKEVLRERSNLLKERIAVEVEKRLPKELFKEISSLVREMEEKAKEVGKSPGLNLLLLYFYYLSKDDLKEVAEKARLPEPVLDDIRLKLKDLKEGLTPRELFEALTLKKEG